MFTLIATVAHKASCEIIFLNVFYDTFKILSWNFPFENVFFHFKKLYSNISDTTSFNEAASISNVGNIILINLQITNNRYLLWRSCVVGIRSLVLSTRDKHNKRYHQFTMPSDKSKSVVFSFNYFQTAYIDWANSFTSIHSIRCLQWL